MANLNDNKIDQVFTPAVLTSILTNVDAVKAQLPLLSLTDEQRASYPAIDVANKIFVEDVLVEMGGAIAAFLPSFMRAESVDNDLKFYEQLDEIESHLLQVLRLVRDLKRVCGAEAYAVALAVYKMVEMANEAGIPGAKEAYDKLKDRFKIQPGKAKGVDTLPSTPIV